MRKTFIVVVVGVLLWYAANPKQVPTVPKAPPVKPAPILPKPKPPRKPCPGPGPCPNEDVESIEGSSTIGGAELNGKSVQCDLPVSQHLKNKGGSNDAGLCVFTSIDMMAQWCNVPELIGFRDYMTKFPGGGYPAKVRQYITKLSKERGRELVEGTDWGQATDADIEKLGRVLKSGRIACVTYGYSPRYGSTVAHMVCCVMVDDDTCVILDNNFPGTYEWMSKTEFIRRWKINHGGWYVWLNAPPPPPIPVNQ